MGQLISEAGRRANVTRPLTRSLDLGEEGLAVNATRTCSIDGCDGKYVARGLCGRHYKAARDADRLGEFATTRTGPNTRCHIDGCTRRADGRLCPTHRTRLRRTGTTDDPPPRLSDEEQIAQNIRITPTGCWEWIGPRNNHGYGRLSGQRYAHRVSWALRNGPIPAGAEILHSCDNPPCCNPDHLSPGTHAQNMAEAAQRKRLPSGDRHWSRRRG